MAGGVPGPGRSRASGRGTSASRGSPGRPAGWSTAESTEGASGGGVFDARSGELVGLIQGYWTVRLVGPAGRVGGEVRPGATAVIPLAQVRLLLREWGLEDLLGD